MQATKPITTVMSPGPKGNGNLLSPPKFENACDRLVWRTSVRYWGLNVKACADACASRAKCVLFAVAITLLRSLSFSKQQALEK